MCMMICTVYFSYYVWQQWLWVWCKYRDMCNFHAWFNSSLGVQSAEHNHHQLLCSLSEGRVLRRPGDHQTRGRVWLRLQQRPSSAHLQQHELRLLPQPLPGAPQPIRCSGAETWSSHHTQSKSKQISSDLHRYFEASNYFASTRLLNVQ